MNPALPSPSPAAKRAIPLIVAFFVLVAVARFAASYVIEYQWWKEMDQVPTWIDLLIYSIAPVIAGTLIAFLALWTAHARGLKFAGTRLGDNRLYALASTLVALLLAWMLASATIDTWTVVRYFGGRAASRRGDRVARFGFQPAAALLPVRSAVLYAAAAFPAGAGRALGPGLLGRRARLATDRAVSRRCRRAGEFDPRIFRLEGALESRFLRGVAAIMLLALALQFFLGRYEMLWQNHGFMVGVDYVAEKITLPLQWLLIVACAGGGGLRLDGPLEARARSWRWLSCCGPLVPPLVSAIYVKPNEISMQRPYIQTHIQATRSAFGLEKRTRETEFAAKLEPRSTSPATSRCSTMCACGTGAPSTTPSRRSRRCGPTTSSPTPTWTAT